MHHPSALPPAPGTTRGGLAATASTDPADGRTPSRGLHPSLGGRSRGRPRHLQLVADRTTACPPVAAGDRRPELADEDGSLVTEYGLLAVVAATIAGVVIQWASGGALVTLFNALVRQARSLVGA